MADLISLVVDNGDPIRCIDLDDARNKAISIEEGSISVDIIPEGTGGLMKTLLFDRNVQEWVPE